MADLYDRPRPSLREFAWQHPIRFVLGEALKFAGVLALIQLFIEWTDGPVFERGPAFRLVTALALGLLVGLIQLFVVRREPKQRSQRTA